MTKDNIKQSINDNARQSKKDNKKKYESSDDDNNGRHTDSEDEMDMQEYRKFLSKLFPSKHINNKIKAGKKLKTALHGSSKKDTKEDSEEEDDDDDSEDTEDTEDDDDEDDDDEDSEDEGDDWETDEEPKSKVKPQVVTRSQAKHNLASKKMDDNKVAKKQNDTGFDEDEYAKQLKKACKKADNKKADNKKADNKKADNKKKKSTKPDEDEKNSDEEEYVDDPTSSSKSNKVNIILTIGGLNDQDYDDEDDTEDDDTEDDDETEDENVSVSSVEDDDPLTPDATNKADKISETMDDKISDMVVDKSAVISDNSGKTDLLKKLIGILSDDNDKDDNKLINKCMNVVQADIKKTKANAEKKLQKTKDKNLRIFKKIIKDKNVMNDFAFYEKSEIEDQKKILRELREINKITRIEKPYRMTLLEADIPTLFKGAAMKKINTLRQMDPGSGEFYKIKNWVDTFMSIPFGKYEHLDVSIDSGVDKCHEFMESAKKTLDDAVYGLNDAKMQIMQMLGQLITNPTSIGCAIAIHGPPGTGKTSLVKEGISKILNRPFAFIALGGATDSSFLEGHGYTYEGSTWGKIVQILIDSKCMNPVIYFDELDKISDTPKGEEIAGILTHLTDTSQNSQFHDKYFSEIEFDLSKCMFIFSYNDESKINPILKDRMYRIQTKGYNLKQKTIIGNDYLLPKIRTQIKFKEEDIKITDDALQYIIENQCNKEDGVRNLKRCLEIIFTKLNLYRLMRPDTNLFEEEMTLKVEFPFKVTKDIVDKLIKKDAANLSALCSMYV
jgi:ATP-dependent Lon protease